MINYYLERFYPRRSPSLLSLCISQVLVDNPNGEIDLAAEGRTVYLLLPFVSHANVQPGVEAFFLHQKLLVKCVKRREAEEAQHKIW